MYYLFAPEKVIIESLNAVQIKGLTTTDYLSVDVDLPNVDIQNMSIESGAFDILMCNHVLEHVADDQAAIDECARVLRSDGIALFTIPGDYTQQSIIEFKELDPNGHYRHYGLDVLSKFARAFDDVTAIDMHELGEACEHIRPHDILFACKKNRIVQIGSINHISSQTDRDRNR